MRQYQVNLRGEVTMLNTSAALASRPLDLFNDQMARSLEDKLFFLDVLDNEPIHTVAEFGCAGAHILKGCVEGGFGVTMLGHDVLKEQCKRALESVPTGTFVWEPMTFAAVCKSSIATGRRQGAKSVLVLSSVLHEVQGMGSRTEKTGRLTKFFDDVVFPMGFDFIVIRDMCVQESLEQARSPEHYATIVRRYGTYEEHVASFEDRHGSVGLYRNLVHFLLKYRNRDYWDVEVEEDYLIPPPSWLQLLGDVEGYAVRHLDHYQPDFIADRIHADFGFDLPVDTHLHMVLEKRC